MKLLFATLILGVSASVFAQDAPTPPTPPIPPTPPVAARVAVMPAMAGDVIVAGVTKNAPFTADESGETVRVMPDGNRIVENWSGRIARNSLGRIRRDVTSGNAGSGAARPFIFDGGMAAPGVVALGTGDSANHVMMTKIDAELAASRGYVLAPSAGSSGGTGGVSVYSTTTGNTDEAKHVLMKKIEASAAKDGTWVSQDGSARVAVESGVFAVAAPRRAEDRNVQTRKESLGTRDFGGVQAEGTRVTTTYAAGSVGNDREIEVTSEVWFSKDLGVIVYSKRNDPRSGETTYQMTNIVRAEPDASVFGNR